MSRRTSSKDDVYLSALDLWSLLLFAFLALAFLVRHGGDQGTELPMPIVRGARARVDRGDDHVLFVAWKANTDVAGSRGQLCKVSVREKALDGKEEFTDVPCWPGAFDGGQKLPLSERLKASAERQDRLVVVCSTEETTLEACARLTLLAHEHEFENVAMYIDRR